MPGIPVKVLELLQVLGQLGLPSVFQAILGYSQS